MIVSRRPRIWSLCGYRSHCKACVLQSEAVLQGGVLQGGLVWVLTAYQCKQELNTAQS